MRRSRPDPSGFQIPDSYCPLEPLDRRPTAGSSAKIHRPFAAGPEAPRPGYINMPGSGAPIRLEAGYLELPGAAEEGEGEEFGFNSC